MNPATGRHLEPVPDLRSDAPVSLVKQPPVATRRKVAVKTPSLRPAVPVLKATAVHTGYGVAGLWRAGGMLWRWVACAELAPSLATNPKMVLTERKRRQKIAGVTSGACLVAVVYSATISWALPTLLLLLLLAAAGWAERRIRFAGVADTGRKAIGRHPGSKAVRRAVAAARLGKFDQIRVVGPVVRDDDRAWTALVEPPEGVTFQAAQKRQAELAAAVGVGLSQISVDPVRGNNGRFTIWCADSDPLSAAPTPSPILDADRWNIWHDRIQMGRDVRGRPVSFALPERSLLVSGEPGGGKSVACANLLCAAALDPHLRLVLADAKGVDLIDWEDMAETYIGKPDPPRLLQVLAELQAEMDGRYDQMAKARIKTVTEEFAAESGIHPLLLHIDELAFYMRSDQGKAITEALRDLVSRGRASLMIVSVATQRPSSTIIDTDLRDLISIRMSMRVTTPASSEMGLGQGWAKQGFDASKFDASQRGAALLLAEGTSPVTMRTGLLTDRQITAICRRAYKLREAAGTLPQSDARPGVRLLKSVLAVMGDQEKVATADILPGVDVATAEELADALRPLGVRPGDQWIDGGNLRGYRRADVLRALERA